MTEQGCSTFSKDPDASFWVLPGLDEAHSALFHPDLTAMLFLENCGKFTHLVATFSKGQLRFYLVEFLKDELAQPKTLRLTKVAESDSAQQKIQQYQFDKKTPSRICIVKSTVEGDKQAEKEGGNHSESSKETYKDERQNQFTQSQYESEDYFSSAQSCRSNTACPKYAISHTEIFQATIGLSLDKIVYLFRVNFTQNQLSSWEVSQVEVQTYEYNGQVIQSFQISDDGNSMLCSAFDPSENQVSVHVEDITNAANRCLICSFNHNKEVLIGKIAASSDMSIIRAFIQIASNKQMYIYTYYFDPIKRSLLTLNRLPITTSLSSQSNARNAPSVHGNSSNLNNSCSLFSETCGVGVMSDGCSLEIHDFNAHSSKPVLKEASMQIYNFDPQTLLVANSTRNLISKDNTTTSTTLLNTPNNNSIPTTIQPSSLALYSFNAPYSALESIPLPSLAKVHNVILCPTKPSLGKSDVIENPSSFTLILAIMADEYATIIPIIIDTSILQDKLPELQTVGSQITLFSSRIDLENIPSKTTMFKTPEAAAKMSNNNFFNFQVFSSLGLSLSQNFGFSSPDKTLRQAQSQEKSSRGNNQGSKGKNDGYLDLNTTNFQQRQNRLLFTENSMTQEGVKYAASDEAADNEFMNKHYKQKASQQYYRASQIQKKAEEGDDECQDYRKEDEQEENDEMENGDELEEESYAFCSNSSDSKGECEECRQKKERQLKKKQIKTYTKHHIQKNKILLGINESLRSISRDMHCEELEGENKSQCTKKPSKAHLSNSNNKRISCGYLDSECEQKQQENTISFSDLSESPCKSASPCRQKRSSPSKRKHKSFAFSLNLVSPPAIKPLFTRNVPPNNFPNSQQSQDTKEALVSENPDSFAPRNLLAKRRISPKRQSNQQDNQEFNKLLHFS